VLAEKVALTVAQAENAEYSLVFHTVRARNFGINDDEILSIREGRVADKKTEVALRFARALSRRTGDYSVEDLRKAATRTPILWPSSHVSGSTPLPICSTLSRGRNLTCRRS
jgi:hypothetical protein